MAAPQMRVWFTLNQEQLWATHRSGNCRGQSVYDTIICCNTHRLPSPTLAALLGHYWGAIQEVIRKVIETSLDKRRYSKMPKTKYQLSEDSGGERFWFGIE